MERAAASFLIVKVDLMLSASLFINCKFSCIDRKPCSVGFFLNVIADKVGLIELQVNFSGFYVTCGDLRFSIKCN